MKKLFPVILFCMIIYFTGCDKPSPTQLVHDEDPLEIEVISKNPDDEFYNNGFDSTGVAELPLRFSNIVTVTGVKITKNNFTFNGSNAQAIFFNKDQPVFNRGRLIGYKTLGTDSILFNGAAAKEIPFIIRYRSGGNVNDTLLGPKYILNNRQGSPEDNFNFNYNSLVEIKLFPGNAALSIPTPAEITGSVRLTGRRQQRNLNLLLEWNAANHPSVEIILGGVRNVGNAKIPLYRLRTRDDGKLLIPVKLIKNISDLNYKSFVITFIRKNDRLYPAAGKEIFTLTQSIHSIIIDIP